MTRRSSRSDVWRAADICVRKYVNLNRLRDMENEDREKILEVLFHYLLRSALLLKDSSVLSSHVIGTLNAPERMVDKEVELFSVGLATRDQSRTSTALKYVACNCQTGSVYNADGVSFEVLVANFLHRYVETLGCMVCTAKVRHAWPPAVGKNAILEEEDIKARVTEMEKNGSAGVAKIASFYKHRALERDRDVALIVRQGFCNAAGPGVILFVLKKDDDDDDGRRKFEVSLFQAENWAKPLSTEKMNESARNIGVEVGSTTAPTTSWVFVPSHHGLV